MHVVDTGKGIKEEDFSKLFTLFGTLQRTASLNNEGIGLGLLICKNLVEQNGGKINVHSLGANMGSTFSFSMKMTIAKNIKRNNISVNSFNFSRLSESRVDEDLIN